MGHGLRKSSGRRGPRRGIDDSVVKRLGTRCAQLEGLVSDGSSIPAKTRIDVAGISRAVASVGDLLSRGINVVFQSGSGWLERPESAVASTREPLLSASEAEEASRTRSGRVGPVGGNDAAA